VSLALRTRDGLSLHGVHWPCTPAQGTVLLVHGLGEHAGRYAGLARRLNAWGWHVVGYDQRGHGESPGARGRIAEPDDLLHDLAAVVDHARTARPGRLVLLGHSLGGLVAARFVAGALAPARPGWSREVDALVLSSPALALDLNPLQRGLLAVLGAVAPDAGVGNGLDPAWLSHDPAVVQAYRDDPRVHDRISPRLLRFMLDAAAAVHAAAPGWRTPTLLLYAGADRCVAPRGSAAFAAAAPPAVLAVRAFAPLFHEIFNELDAEPVFECLRAWLGPAAPAPTPPG
jgi:alpha-beta hydrolase superfamily lysophospholipase